MYCELYKATIRVAACLGYQADPYIWDGSQIIAIREPCKDCDQGRRAQTGEFNDEDVEILMQTVSAAESIGVSGNAAGQRRSPRLKDDEAVEKVLALTEKAREIPEARRKRCPKCGETKDRMTDFHVDETRPDGRAACCKSCRNRYGKNYWAKTKRDADMARSKEPQNTAAERQPPDELTAGMTLTLDFTPYPEALEMLKESAEGMMRTPEMQALWILSEILERARHRLED